MRPERLAKGFAQPFDAFAKFADGIGLPAPALNGTPARIAGVLELHGLRFVCANSAWFCRDSETDRGQLWLGLPQLQTMRLMDPEDYDAAPVTVALAHHPQECLANAEYTAYDNRPAAYEYLRRALASSSPDARTGRSWTRSDLDEKRTSARGASSGLEAIFLRAAVRYGGAPASMARFIGFRCVRE